MSGSRFRPQIGLLLSSVAALILVAPANLNLLRWTGDALRSTPQVIPLRPAGPLLEADLDGDGVRERVDIHDSVASIHSGDRVVWSSPQGWRVHQAHITDLNWDGEQEVALLLWRPFAPWPIDEYLVSPGRIADFHDAKGMSCHLILIGWHKGTFREIWAGSALADPVLGFAAADVDGDATQELITLEGQYDRSKYEARFVSVWEWNGFGFSLRFRGPEGRYVALTPVRHAGDPDLLLVQGSQGGEP